MNCALLITFYTSIYRRAYKVFFTLFVSIRNYEKIEKIHVVFFVAATSNGKPVLM